MDLSPVARRPFRAAPQRSAGLVQPLLVTLIAALAACGGGGTISPSPSPEPSLASGGGCLPAPAASNLDGWGAPSEAPAVIPQVISSDQVCGENRFLFGLLGADNRSLAAPDRKVTVRFFDLGRDPTNAVATADGEFIWAIDDVVGVYHLDVAFSSVGVWGAEFQTTDANGASTTIRMTFNVIAHGRAIQVGDRAPKSDNPVLADVGGDVKKISSDAHPVKRFYESTIADAIDAHAPFVLIFATPAFCTSGQCGPTLERVKPVAAKHPNVTVINVEPYELKFEGGQLQPALDAQRGLVPVPATTEWGLPSEPWIYVVDGDGIVTASFEGIVSAEELEAAVAAVE
jgi:hypothetical protein